MLVVLLSVGVWGSNASAFHVIRASNPRANNPLPVVLWHGMGDSCCSSSSIGAVKQLIEETLGVFVYSIATGNSESADVWSSYFGDLNDQVATVCSTIRSIPELQQGYNAVGFSQGGQFLRAVIQRCQHLGPKASTLITVGAQHQGVMNIPGCSDLDHVKTLSRATIHGQACKAMQLLISKGAYLPIIQNHVVQAQYFKDPNHLDEYLKQGIFLPDINNEHDAKSLKYKSNLMSLDKFVMFRFADDKTVVPRDSSWFSFFNGTQLLPLAEQPLYTEDWLGLQALDQQGKLVFAEVPGAHMHFTFAWFTQEIIIKYLA